MLSKISCFSIIETLFREKQRKSGTILLNHKTEVAVLLNKSLKIISNYTKKIVVGDENFN